MDYLTSYKIFESFNVDIDYVELQRELIEDCERENEAHDRNVLIKKSEQFISKIQSLFSDNTIKVYRHMNVSYEWLDMVLMEENMELGAFWSYYKETAFSWDSINDIPEIEVLLTAEIDIKYINWYNTLVIYFIFGGKEIEAELDLSSDVKFKLLTIESGNGEKLMKKYVINRGGYTK